MKIHCKDYRLKTGGDFKFSKLKTSSGYKKPEETELNEMMKDISDKISELQYKMYAENLQSLLIILQGMDSSGKDGVIKFLVSGVNPQGVSLHSFKHPNEQELKHDYLWRHYMYMPEQGQIGIFNRSHYENVLISKVHKKIALAERIPGITNIEQINSGFWKKRYKQINEFENIITQTGTHILKFFLHLSKDEQCERFLDRLENKEKNWKFSSSDIIERGYWDKYQKAYKDMLKNTNTGTSSWYAIPADEKWFSRLLIGKIILEKLIDMKPGFPAIDKEEQEYMKVAKEQLLREQKK